MSIDIVIINIIITTTIIIIIIITIVIFESLCSLSAPHSGKRSKAPLPPFHLSIVFIRNITYSIIFITEEANPEGRNNRQIFCNFARSLFYMASYLRVSVAVGWLVKLLCLSNGAWHWGKITTMYHSIPFLNFLAFFFTMIIAICHKILSC